MSERRGGGRGGGRGRGGRGLNLRESPFFLQKFGNLSLDLLFVR